MLKGAPPLPGPALYKEYMRPRSMTVVGLSRLTGYSHRHISGFINGKASLSPLLAVTICRVLADAGVDLDPVKMLTAQAEYDVFVCRNSRWAEKKIAKQTREKVKADAGTSTVDHAIASGNTVDQSATTTTTTNDGTAPSAT